MTKFIIAFVLTIVVLVVGTKWYHQSQASKPALQEVVTTPSGLSFGYASTTYGLATTPEQVLVKSYIPPCNEGFEYCFYRLPGAYEGTNFESAGLSVKTRKDFTTQDTCLSTPPDGYTNVKPNLMLTSTVATAAFPLQSEGAAGHTAEGAVERIWYKNVCTELQTQIGVSQFANYPAGSIKEFAATDLENVRLELRKMLKDITIDITPVQFATLP